METVLSYLVSTTDQVQALVVWSMAHPIASAFWGAIVTALLDRIVKLTPWKGDDSALDIIETAIKQAIAKAFNR